MKRIAVTLVMILIFRILAITAYAAFPTFVWTGEYRSRIYAVEMAADEEIILFDIIEDESATPTDLDDKEPIPDEGMNIAAFKEDTDSDAKIITSYDIEPGTEEDAEPAEEQQEDEHNTEPEQEG